MLNEQKTKTEAVQKDLDEYKKTTKDTIDKLTAEKRGIDEYKRTTTDAFNKLVTEKKVTDDRVKQLESDVDKLGSEVLQVDIHPGIVRDPEKYKHSGMVTVGIEPGKQAEAALLCQAMGFELAKPPIGPNPTHLTFRLTREVTIETLRVIANARSLIKFMQPNSPVQTQWASRR